MVKVEGVGVNNCYTGAKAQPSKYDKAKHAIKKICYIVEYYLAGFRSGTIGAFGVKAKLIDKMNMNNDKAAGEVYRYLDKLEAKKLGLNK